MAVEDRPISRRTGPLPRFHLFVSRMACSCKASALEIRMTGADIAPIASVPQRPDRHPRRMKPAPPAPTLEQLRRVHHQMGRGCVEQPASAIGALR